MASVPPHHLPPPHPYLSEPLLYVTNLAANVSDADLAMMLGDCAPFRPRIARDGSDRPSSGTIEFRHIEKAEKALATLQSRPIPNVVPTALLTLSPFPPTQPPTLLPPPSASPRLVKQLPPGYNDSRLYDLFRPFGALASARTQVGFGKDTGVIEFWREEDAKVAEENMHCAEVDDVNIAVQVYQPRRVSGGAPEFSAAAPAFVPSGSVLPYPTQYSPPRAFPFPQPRQSPAPFVHGPGQQVQFAPMHGPGSNSHSGLIDPCNLFCKNLDPEIDSNALFAHFRNFGQIVSARVMRDDNGRSRGFGFVSFQQPDQAAQAMNGMNGVVLGSKQLIVRLHEPKQLRQEKLAQRFAGHNGHPRSRSGATSPTASEGGESSFSGWPSPGGGYSGLSSPKAFNPTLTQERGRRSSGSYYNAALSGQLNMPLTYDDLSALSPVVRKEVLTGELQRRVKMIRSVPKEDIDSIVEALTGLSLATVVDGIQYPAKLAEQVQILQSARAQSQSSSPAPEASQPQSPSPAASQDSRLLDPNALNATASAPEHPSTPVSFSASLSTPPRTSSPAGSVHPAAGASERERLRAAVGRLEPSRAAEITELLMSLSKRERAMCLFNVEVLRVKVADAKAVLDSEEDPAEDDVPVPAPAPAASPAPTPAPAPAPAQVPVPSTPVARKVSAAPTESPQTPDLSSRGASAAGSPAMPSTPAAAPAYTLAALARMPAAKILELANSPSATGLPLPKADPLVVKATDDFVDSLKDQSVPKQKQQVGDKLFRVVKAFGIKGAPKVTIALLDQDDLRSLAHLMNSYPTVLKEKAILVQSGGSK